MLYADLLLLCLQVPIAHIYRLDLIPDIDQGVLQIKVLGSPAASAAQVQVGYGSGNMFSLFM